MIASFFQSLDQNRVEYLLISGQAAVLYGAAAFSEDIDLWVEPAAQNLNGRRQSLAEVGARYYKLTPPLDESFALLGHGFHFTLGTELTFLDVMGNPPRVGGFARAAARSVRMETKWGTLPVISIPDLVELKLT